VNDKRLSTEELADLFQVKPTSIRVRLCRCGSYFGLKPVKLPNGKLSWPPVDEVEAVIHGRAVAA